MKVVVDDDSSGPLVRISDTEPNKAEVLRTKKRKLNEISRQILDDDDSPLVRIDYMHKRLKRRRSSSSGGSDLVDTRMRK